MRFCGSADNYPRHLHHILHALMSLPPSQALPSLLILAHKADLIKSSTVSSTTGADALAVNRVKTILERELERRRTSLSGGVAVEGLGEEGERTDMGGLECRGSSGVFRFAEWEGGEVTSMGTFVKASTDKEKDEDGLQLLKEWLHENI